MNPWILLNTTLSVYVAVVITALLFGYHHKVSWQQMLAKGFIGGSMILNIAPIMVRGGVPFGGGGTGTPFDDWAGTLLRLGLAIYFTCRLLHHYFAGQQQLRNSRDYLRQRGEY